MSTTTTKRLLLWLLAVLLLAVEPALANKFETIGNGVAGSNKIKIEYLKPIALVAGIIMLSAGVLSLVMRQKNAQHLNYTMWKSSSFVFFLIGAVSVAVAYYL